MLSLQMDMIIDLDIPQVISIKELEEKPFVKHLLFQITPDHCLTQKLKKIDQFIPYLCRYPTIQTAFSIKPPQTFSPVFSTVAVGGTFDHLHLGHQVLLLYSSLTATHRIYIGVTGEALLGKKKSKIMLEPWQLRMKHVQAFVKSIKPQLEVILFELNNPFGVTIEEPNIDALVISEETQKGGEKVNEERAKLGMQPLSLITCPTVSPTNDVENKFSSTFIREYLLSKNCLTIEQYSQYRESFDALIHRLQVKDREKVEDCWAELFLSYSQHWRHYHTNQHIFRMLQEWKGAAFADRRAKLTQHQTNIVELAIFFHDAVYQADGNANEEESAKLASHFIKQLLPDSTEAQDLISQATLLILQTKNHQPTNALSQIFYDLDMGILNSDSKYYQQYARGIKREYYPLFGEQYWSKRAELLTKWKESKLHFSFEPTNISSNISWELYCLEHHDL